MTLGGVKQLRFKLGVPEIAISRAVLNSIHRCNYSLKGTLLISKFYAF